MRAGFILMWAIQVGCFGLWAAEKETKSTEQTASIRLREQRKEHYILGRYVYERNCQICHGRRGDGEGEWSPGLLPRPRSFREAHFKYRSTPFGKLPTDADLRRTIRGGRSNTAMGMFTKLSEREVDAVIVYIKTFSRKWKNDELYASPQTLPEKPDWFNDVEKRAYRAIAGEQIFATACVQCHGQEADGHGPQSMNLQDSLGRPIKPANLLVPHLRSGDSEFDLVRVLMTGLNGTPMLSFAETLGSEEIWELAAYLHNKRQTAERK